MHILIADDDALTRAILKKQVQKLGHTCLLASHGGEAWSLFQSYPFDAIISDWMMPELTGLELCDRVRAETSVPYTFFILQTAKNEKQNYILGMQTGADAYLTKPVDVDELEMVLISAQRVTSLHRQLLEQKAELERLNRKLHEEGRRDGLTGLRNRLCLNEDLAVLGARSVRYGYGYSIALCDLDFYKAYNDRYGHQAGDDVLRAVANTMQATMRSGDAVYRYGGEEFLVLLPEQTIHTAANGLKRLCDNVLARAIPHAASPHGAVTISVGIAEAEPKGTISPEAVISQADQALYYAKHQGRNCVALHGDNACQVFV